MPVNPPDAASIETSEELLDDSLIGSFGGAMAVFL